MQAVITSGVLTKVVQFLSNDIWSLVLPAVRLLGNIACGTEQQNHLIFSSGAISAFPFLLNHPRRVVRKEALWTVSNLLVGGPAQIQLVVAANLVPRVVGTMVDADATLRQEALIGISNLLLRGSFEQVEYAIELGAIHHLVQMLNDPVSSIIMLALESAATLMNAGDRLMQLRNLAPNPFQVAFAQDGGRIRLETLLRHDDGVICEAAAFVLVRLSES